MNLPTTKPLWHTVDSSGRKTDVVAEGGNQQPRTKERVVSSPPCSAQLACLSHLASAGIFNLHPPVGLVFQDLSVLFEVRQRASAGSDDHEGDISSVNVGVLLVVA